METVMMTGSTGFIGRTLAHHLLDEGYELKLLVRSPSRADDLEARGAELIQGDLRDPDSIRRAMEGVDGVYHLAAIYRLGGDIDRMRSVNVEGTRNILDQATRKSLDVLYCGSDTSLGNTDGEVRDEDHEHDGDFRSNYERTKYEAHQLVEERIQRGERIVHAIVSSVYGPGDESPLADLIENHLAGRAIAYLDRDAGYTFTHVDDVAEGLRLAYENGRIGESYLISGEPASFEQFFTELSERTGIPEPGFEVPDCLIDYFESIARKVETLTGNSRSFVSEMIEMGRNVTRFFSSEKAKNELGFEPQSLEEGLRDTIPFFGRKEYTRSRNFLEQLSYPLIGLALFDLALGSTALFFPDLYRGIVHPFAVTASGGTDASFLRRTGVLWLVFSGVQYYAGADSPSRPGWVLAAGVLRLMDVPADPVYYLVSDGFGWLGSLGVLSAPVFNAITGGIFVYGGYRGLRAMKWSSTLEESQE